MRGIAAVFFDAGGTLFEVRGSVGRVYSDIARRHGFRIDPRELDRKFREAFARKSGAFPPDAVSERQWWFEIVRYVLREYLSPEKVKTYFDELYEFFRTADAWAVYPEVVESLTRLRACGFRLGVISNFDARLKDILTNLGIDGYFELTAISWEIRAAKPDPRIFMAAIETMNISPNEAWHVGDSIHEDVEGAQKAGLRAVLLDRRGVHSGWTGCPVIRSLTELESLVGADRHG